MSAIFLAAMCAGISPPDFPNAPIKVLKSVIPLNRMAPTIVFKADIGFGLTRLGNSVK